MPTHLSFHAFLLHNRVLIFFFLFFSFSIFASMKSKPLNENPTFSGKEIRLHHRPYGFVVAVWVWKVQLHVLLSHGSFAVAQPAFAHGYSDSCDGPIQTRSNLEGAKTDSKKWISNDSFSIPKVKFPWNIHKRNMRLRNLILNNSKSNFAAEMVDIRKRRSNQPSKRKETLLKKLHEMALLCDVDVAFFRRVRKIGRITTYRSLDHESWPPSREQMVTFSPNTRNYS